MSDSDHIQQYPYNLSTIENENYCDMQINYNNNNISRMASRGGGGASSSGGGRGTKRRGGGGSQQQDMDYDNGSTDDYRQKRDRNNAAVKRSRVKSRQRTQETMDRVNRLKTENDQLEEKIKLLSKELGFLKDLFLAHAGSSHNVDLKDIDLEALLNDESIPSFVDSQNSNVSKPQSSGSSSRRE
ncbi:CCAAT/enhancer-binding protein gamma isoform X2 [Nilaparvata lugens]|uniref:CCAAT/enhancer-binding protein gamma isoform X2 n=1 Tax=Nilaparvata lugens TaxID=108931 RepID=UPI00193E7E09|nr:CCAAT/enhancer-binding protein gamma isoform X2 [Nilaparvata lugens]